MKFQLEIASTIERLMAQEDTDRDHKITIEDNGPKSFSITSDRGLDYEVKGTYYLSNLLQELVLAKQLGQVNAIIDIERIEELPADRISRMIKDYYWAGLTRTMDADGIENLISDTKNDSLTAEKLPVYVPFNDDLAMNYYKGLSDRLPLKVVALPKDITPEYVKTINRQPGILSLKLEKRNGEIKGVPFVVPGGRFNEMYGWDSYFESVGLMIDGKVELAKAMADNFQYEIENYGKILNANRSYYLTRTQPPFYSSLIREVYAITKDKEWLMSHLKTAIKEYETVWMVEDERLTDIGLNRYLANGIGIPPETEDGHFNSAIKPYADRAGISIIEYIEIYRSGEISESELDMFFVHDRSMRESGHDTSNRLDGKCADIIPVELNAFLFKYEMDFSEIILKEFENYIEINQRTYTSEYWKKLAEKRRRLVDQYLWSEEKGMYFDFNLNTEKPETFISATALTALWAGISSKTQADKLVKSTIPLLKEEGGIASCTEESRGLVDEQHPQRQWDYPNGWAPHQMMIWKGLMDYEFTNVATELIYRWLYMITKNAVDYNGTIPEKYDVVNATHKVFAEYGNVGTDFSYITQEGFGWMNASYQFGLSLLNSETIDNLNKQVSPDKIF